MENPNILKSFMQGNPLLKWFGLLVGFSYLVYFFALIALLKEKGMPSNDPASFVLFALFIAPFLVFCRAKIVDKKKMISFFVGLLMSVVVSLYAFQQFGESGLLTIWEEEMAFKEFYLSLEKNVNLKNLSRTRTPKGSYILFGTIKSKEDIENLEKEIKRKKIICTLRFVVEGALENEE